MANFICKLDDMYFEWSTIVDAPITYGMTKEEFLEYYREEYGRNGFENELPRRLERVEEKGTSSLYHGSVDDVISCNRAGDNETSVTKEELIEYLRNGVDWEE